MGRSEELDPKLREVESLVSQARPSSGSVDPLQLMYQAGWDAATASHQHALKIAAGKPLGSRRKQNRIDNADSSNFRLQMFAAFSSIAALLLLGLFLMQSFRKQPSNIQTTGPQVDDPDPMSQFQAHISGLTPSHSSPNHSNGSLSENRPLTGSIRSFRFPATRKNRKRPSRRLIEEFDETFGVPGQNHLPSKPGFLPQKN